MVRQPPAAQTVARRRPGRIVEPLPFDPPPPAEEVISHVVLFRPRPDVSADDRRAFVAALEDAFRHIPTIRRAVVGRSLPGDQGLDFPYVAIIEFDDEHGYQTYLAHPLHLPVARLFHHTCEATTIVNAQTIDARESFSRESLSRVLSGSDAGRR